MKNKGFTIMELMAVIVILGILTTLAAVGVTKYRQTVKEKELVNLHSTIEAAYDNYRSSIIMSGGSASKEINFSTLDDNTFNKYFADFTYNGNHLTQSDLSKSVFSLKIKGDLLNKSDYTNKKTEENFVKDGACLVGSEITDVTNEDSTKTKEIVKNCKKNGGSPIPSQEEMLCIVLEVNGEKLINDFDENKSMQPLCVYFNKPNNVTNSGVVEE